MDEEINKYSFQLLKEAVLELAITQANLIRALQKKSRDESSPFKPIINPNTTFSHDLHSLASRTSEIIGRFIPNETLNQDQEKPDNE